MDVKEQIEHEQSSPSSRRQRILRREEIERLIGSGAHIFILDGKVINATSFVKYHPGGRLALQHMVGRDATDEVKAYEYPNLKLHSPKALQKMNAFQIGRIEGNWLNFRPPIQGGQFRTSEADLSEKVKEEGEKKIAVETDNLSTKVDAHRVDSPETKKNPHRPLWLDTRTQQEIELDWSRYPAPDPETQRFIIQKYRELTQKIKDEGLFKCNYAFYLTELLRYSTLGFISFTTLRAGWYCSSAFFLGLMWHLLVFAAHDAGHMEITHNFQIDSTIGIIIADCIGGLSLGWWKRSHNVHHIVTNSTVHDPDIQHLPFFAVSHQFFSNLRSTYYERVMKYDRLARFLISKQHYLYYLILCFGRFNLYRLSWEYLLCGQAPMHGIAAWHRWFEVAGQIFFWIWFGYGVMYRSIPDWTNRILFLLISHAVTSPLHVQITISHFGMSTSDLGPHESFAQRALRTTMDIDCPTWMDFYHGGLQYQAVHHMFPRLPRHNLRRASVFVQQWCKEVEIPYVMFTFTCGNKYVLGHMGEIAKMAKMLEACRKSIAEDMLDEGASVH
ncbi:hypothetical protein KEM54_005278 [Ascosphaera aggregata]|nr:hypothetical protein KEM54_005278 [Ascosphaera aggregata]